MADIPLEGVAVERPPGLLTDELEATVEAYAIGLQQQLARSGVSFAILLRGESPEPGEGRFLVWSNTEPVDRFLEEHAELVRSEPWFVVRTHEA